jgi:hypothetical protein
MLAFANDLVARAARLVIGEEPSLWTISTGRRVVGAVVRESGTWRLSWFADADTRLTSFPGPVDGDLEALAAALTARLGRPVELVNAG